MATVETLTEQGRGTHDQESLADQILTVAAVVGAAGGAVAGAFVGSGIENSLGEAWTLIGTLLGGVGSSLFGLFVVAPAWGTIVKAREVKHAETDAAHTGRIPVGHSR